MVKNCKEACIAKNVPKQIGTPPRPELSQIWTRATQKPDQGQEEGAPRNSRSPAVDPTASSLLERWLGDERGQQSLV